MLFFALGCCLLSAGTFTAAASAETLLVSKAPDRSDPQPLADTTQVQGTQIYVFAEAGANITRVRFYLDDPGMWGQPRQIESFAPFDFNVTAGDGTARAFDVSALSVGSHTITAAMDKREPGAEVRSATFTVENRDTPAENREMLAVSTDPSRSDPQPLADSTHARKAQIYVFTQSSADVRRVRFHLDDPTMLGEPRRVESVAPYDFNVTAGDGTAIAFDVGTLSEGSHTITAAQETTSGQTRVLSATFAVRASDRPVEGPGPTGRELIFEDNFDGSALNTEAWDPYYSAGNAGIGLRRPSALTLSEGNLVVTAQTSGGQLISGGMALRRPFTYGRVEFRVKTGLDPTGTMSGAVLTWPNQQWSPEFTENDIYETGPVVNNRSEFWSFIHYSTSNQQYYFKHDADPSQWHTMAMDWSPDELKIYRDGVVVWTLTDRAAIPDVLHHLTIQLDPMRWANLPTPVRMYVDWVRVYR